MASWMTNHNHRMCYMIQTSPENGGKDKLHALKSVGGVPRWSGKESTWFVNQVEFSVKGWSCLRNDCLPGRVYQVCCTWNGPQAGVGSV